MADIIENTTNDINEITNNKKEIGYFSDDDNEPKIKVGKLKLNEKFKAKLTSIIGEQCGVPTKISSNMSSNNNKTITVKNHISKSIPKAPPLTSSMIPKAPQIVSSPIQNNSYNQFNQMITNNLNVDNNPMGEFMAFLLKEHMEDYKRLKERYINEEKSSKKNVNKNRKKYNKKNANKAWFLSNGNYTDRNLK